jgi:menaquinone-dependent protoporphyrinogen oxidase
VPGSALHNQTWLPEVLDCVRRHSPVLAERPKWLFSVGMPAAPPRMFRRAAQDARDRRLAGALRDEVRPRSHRLFSAVCRPN